MCDGVRLCPVRAVHVGLRATTLIRSQRVRVSSVEKTPSFSLCQVDIYASASLQMIASYIFV